MIPIFSILSLFLSLLLFICFIKVYFSSRHKKLETVSIFSKSLLFLSLFWFMLGVPQLITDNLKIIQLFSNLSIFFGFLAMVYFFPIPLKIYYQRELPGFVLFGIVSLGIAILIFNILNLKPAYIHFQNNFVFWSDNRNLLTDVVSNVLFALMLVVGALFFYRGGLKAKERVVKLRAFLFAAALICILSTGIPQITSLSSNSFVIFVSKLSILALETISAFLMAIAIFFAEPKAEKSFYKKVETEKRV